MADHAVIDSLSLQSQLATSHTESICEWHTSSNTIQTCSLYSSDLHYKLLVSSRLSQYLKSQSPKKTTFKSTTTPDQSKFKPQSLTMNIKPSLLLAFLGAHLAHSLPLNLTSLPAADALTFQNGTDLDAEKETCVGWQTSRCSAAGTDSVGGSSLALLGAVSMAIAFLG
jgi:hypothetical protein